MTHLYFFRLNSLYEQIKTQIEVNSKDYPIKSIVQCGSSAKGTSTDDSDIDVFICFDLEYSWDKFPDYIHKLAPLLFEEYEIKHATYPYIEAQINQISVNVVPCYHTESIAEIRSPVDRSPHHVTWVNENLTQDQKQDVKKLKEFLKLNGLYGADNNTKGFSGYLCEVLIHLHGTFQKLLEDYAYTEQNDLSQPPFYLADPIDPRRHLSAAVSGENWGKLILAARTELGHGQPETANIDIESLHEYLKDNIVTIKLNYDDLAKIRKEAKKIVGKLKKEGFNVLTYTVQPYLVVLLVEAKKLSRVYLKPDVIKITSNSAHKNIPKINPANTIKYIVTDKLTLSFLKLRNPLDLEIEIFLGWNGYLVEKCELDNYAYKKALSTFLTI